MFSSNDKISMRQSFRLFTFDFVGISSLIVPPYLAKTVGADGIFCILLGCVLGIIYLLFLGGIHNRMGKDMGTFMEEYLPAPVRILAQLWMLFHCVMLAGFVSYVFGILMQHSLIREESYPVIILVILVTAGYAVSGGIESRARVYEVLFWFVFLPLIGMLISAGTQMETVYLDTFFEAGFMELLKGSYLVFLFSGIAFWMLFFPKYIHEEKTKGPFLKSVGMAMAFTAVILICVYFISVGNFGVNALAKMEFPVVTLMSSIKIPGNFIKRLDAVMLGIWFFTLFALLNLHVFYGAKMMKGVLAFRGNKRYIAGTLVCILPVTLFFYYRQEMVLNWFFRYIWYLGTPFMILVPLLVYWIGKGRKT